MMQTAGLMLSMLMLVEACARKDGIGIPEHSFGKGKIVHTNLLTGSAVEKRLVAYCTDSMDEGFRSEIGIFRYGGDDEGLADIEIRETKVDSHRDGYSFTVVRGIASAQSLKIVTESSVMLVSSTVNSVASGRLDVKPVGTQILAIPLENSKDVPMEVKVTLKGYLEKTISCRTI